MIRYFGNEAFGVITILLLLLIIIIIVFLVLLDIGTEGEMRIITMCRYVFKKMGRNYMFVCKTKPEKITAIITIKNASSAVGE